MKNVTENNKLIAEFMGCPKHKIDFVGKRLNFENSKHNTYHKDWNWLMVVVRKCREFSNEEDSHWENIYYALTDLDIYRVYMTCVEFIKWYNKQK